MSSMEEPKNAMAPQDPELELTDGGWDPYVASLLASGGKRADAAGDEDDNAPVMTLSQAAASRGK